MIYDKSIASTDNKPVKVSIGHLIDVRVPADASKFTVTLEMEEADGSLIESGGGFELFNRMGMKTTCAPMTVSGINE